VYTGNGIAGSNPALSASALPCAIHTILGKFPETGPCGRDDAGDPFDEGAHAGLCEGG